MSKMSLRDFLLSWLVIGVFLAPFAVGWLVGGDQGVGMVGTGLLLLIAFGTTSFVIAVTIADMRGG